MRAKGTRIWAVLAVLALLSSVLPPVSLAWSGGGSGVVNETVPNGTTVPPVSVVTPSPTYPGGGGGDDGGDDDDPRETPSPPPSAEPTASGEPTPGPTAEPTPEPSWFVPTPVPDETPVVEESPPPEETSGEPGPEATPGPGVVIPKTGDDRRPGLWLGLALASFAGMVCCVWYAARRRYRGRRVRR